MTDNQKRQILILRNAGYGYSKLGISHCRRNSLREREEITCLQCGAPRETTTFFQVNSERGFDEFIHPSSDFSPLRHLQIQEAI